MPYNLELIVIMKEFSKDYCPKCYQITNHKRLSTQKQSDPYSDFFWQYDYDVIQCLGCEHLQFRKGYHDESMLAYDENGELKPFNDYSYYPKHLNHHHKLNNLINLPVKIRSIYNETIKAFTNNCYLLAGAGLRAVIEAVSIERDINGKNLEIKINNLVKNKLITENDGNRLHSIRFLGNDSIHEMDIPKEEKLRIALQIIEHLLNNLYLIDVDVERHLDSMITSYDRFKAVLTKKVKLSTLKEGEEVSLKVYLGKDYRRLESSYIANFTSQLIDDINKNLFTSLAIGSVKENGDQLFYKTNLLNDF